MLFKREEVMQRVAEVPTWVKILAFLIFTTYLFAQAAIQYVYGCVVSTLVVVESDDTTAILRTSSADNDPDAPLPPYSDKESDVKEPLVQQEILLIKSKPITSSLRGTIRHLRSRGANGFRGAGVAAIYFVLLHWIVGITGIIAPYSIPVRLIGLVGGQVMLTRLGMLWTHIAISEPSPKRWYKRIVPRSVAKKVMLPTLAVSLASVATPLIPALAFQLLDPAAITNTPTDEQTTAQRIAAALKVLAVLFSGLVYFVMIVIPMSVGLVRVYAAQLPAEETPIIPFDRTFGGLVVSEAEGGNGKLSLKDAWKSFDWNGRVRLIKVYVKMTMMLVALTMFFFLAIGFLGVMV